MAFTYDTSNPTDITRVRYHLADTVEADAIWSDEDITYAITLNDGSWQRAVVSLIEQYITTLARTPQFSSDWLSVNPKSSIDAWRMLLMDKRREFGLKKIVATVTHTYRADSRQESEPDYTEDNTDEDV
jgi:hypothetical protein